MKKKFGKSIRYSFGNNITINSNNRLVYITSMSKMTNEGLVESTKESIWLGLCGLWNTVRIKGHLRTISQPVWGSGLSRTKLT